jgi:ABC-type Fe3+-hydroxamate transport system substrate-binding protein
LTLEFVLAQAPEVIIDTTMDNEDGSPTHADFWKALPTLPAVREGRVYQGRADQLLRPGPRAPESLKEIARFVHPERFAAGTP